MADSIYEDLLEWSKASLLPWQQDALRRIVQADFLSKRDTEEVASIAYTAVMEPRRSTLHEVAEQQEQPQEEALVATPLGSAHLPARSADAPAVRLRSVRHLSGVNRLKQDAEIPLSPEGLTVIYGGNGVGKSGFTRILKRACHSRSPEPIVPNVFVEGAVQPRAAVTYMLGDEEQTHTWDLDKDSTDPNLPRISVYDNLGAKVHFDRNGAQVELLPPGLDALSRLSAFYDEIAAWAKSELARRAATLAPESHRTAVALRSAMDSVGSAGAIATLRGLATVSEAETKELEDLPEQIRTLESGSRKNRIAAETNRQSQFTSQGARLSTSIEAFSDQQIAQLHEAATKYASTLEEAARAPEPPSELLEGVHGAHWNKMWAAAIEYALKDAYPGDAYEPEEGSLCLLCQQPLDAEASARLQRYADTKAESSVARLARLKRTYDEILESMTSSSAETVLDMPLLGLLDADMQSPDGPIKQAVNAVTKARAACEHLAAGATPKVTEQDLEALREVKESLARLLAHTQAAAEGARVNVETLSSQSDDPEEISRLRARLALLQERKALAANLDGIIHYHNAVVEKAALEEMIGQCNTRSVSTKSGNISKEYVTAICDGFNREVGSLGGSDISASMEPLTNNKGVRRTGIVLRHATNASVPAGKVLSEGEIRVMSLAAFFADLRGSGDTSGIVFDDPMTSLDHNFQRQIAERLVREARVRQVVVFTHSMAFQSALESAIESDVTAQVGEGIDPPHTVKYTLNEIVKDASTGLAGYQVKTFVTSSSVFKERLKHLDSLVEEAKSRFEAGEPEEYQRALENFAVHLRRTWETAVEDILLCKIVRRNRASITTNNLIGLIVGIEPTEIVPVLQGMDTESFYMHSTADGNEHAAPKPDDLRTKVTDLRDWEKTVKARQGAVKARYPGLGTQVTR